MKSVFEYTDYRKVISDYYEERKRVSAFTWHEFAVRAGFSSDVYLKYVGEGKKNLSNAAAKQAAAAMDLKDAELTYFELLVEYSHAKSDEAKRVSFAKICAFADAHKVKFASRFDFEFFSSWKNIVMREIAPALPGAKPLEMAKACKPAITAAEVTEILGFLTKSGLLQKNPDGTYKQTDRMLFMDSFDVKEIAARDLQVQMATLAVDAIKNIPKPERDVSGVTLGLTEEACERIKQEITEFRHRIMAIATEDEKTERVYRLNLQFFPLSEKLKRKNDEKESQ